MADALLKQQSIPNHATVASMYQAIRRCSRATSIVWEYISEDSHDHTSPKLAARQIIPGPTILPFLERAM